MEDKLYLENIEEYVYDLDKIVTYKWLAMTLSVSFSEATRMLSEFVQLNSAPPPPKQPIHVMYLITGVSRDLIIVSLVDQDEIEEMKAGLDEVISVIIYSIQKGHQLQDRSSLQTAEYDVLQENLHNYCHSCSVKCSQSSDDQHDKVTADSQVTLSLVKKEKEQDHGVKQDGRPEKLAPQQSKGLSLHKRNKATSKPKGIAAMFAAKQPKNVSQKPKSEECDKSSQKQEDQTIKGDTSGIVQPSVKSTGTTQFDKEVFTTDDDDHNDHVDHVDHIDHTDHVDHVDNVDHNNHVDNVIIEDRDQRGVASNPVTGQVCEHKQLGKSKEQKKNKKRRRVCQELSSGESDEDTVAVTNKMPVETQSVDTTGAKKRKTVRRLVDKMFIDDDGSMVTEKEWQEVSTDDDNEPVVAISNKPKAISSVKQKSKQSTLGAFFNRK